MKSSWCHSEEGPWGLCKDPAVPIAPSSGTAWAYQKTGQIHSILGHRTLTVLGMRDLEQNRPHLSLHGSFSAKKIEKKLQSLSNAMAELKHLWEGSV